MFFVTNKKTRLKFEDDIMEQRYDPIILSQRKKWLFSKQHFLVNSYMI